MKPHGPKRRITVRWSVYLCTIIALGLIALSIWVEPYIYTKSASDANGVSHGFSFILTDGVLMHSNWQETPQPPIVSRVSMNGLGKHGALPPKWYSMPLIQRGYINIPLVYPAGLLVLFSVLLYLTSRKLHAPGHCASCGYDLSGLDECNTTTCPECGRESTP